MVALTGERRTALSPKSGTRQRVSLLPLPVNLVLRLLDSSGRYNKEIKDKQIGKEEVKLFLFQMTCSYT